MSFPVKRIQKCPRNLPIRVKGRVLMRLRKGGLNIINIKERVANRLGVLCKSVINVNELDFQVRFQSSKNQL